MAPTTVQQIIGRGEYLNPNFDPSALTLAQLRGLFTYHSISYPTSHTKGDLLKVFNEDLKPRASEFKRTRAMALRQEPSDEGIVDGLTGRRVNGGDDNVEPAPRRSSRRPSRQPEEREEAPVEQSKRRRTPSTPIAGPSVGSRRTAPQVQPKVEEESEPEEEPQPRKVSRKKTTASEPVGQSRRSAKSPVSDDDDRGAGGTESAWEDNNPFQSGQESSSPDKPRRKTRKGDSVEPTVDDRQRIRRKAVERVQHTSSPPAPEPISRPRPPSSSKPRLPSVEVSIPTYRGYNPPPERVLSGQDWRRQGARVEEQQEVHTELEDGEVEEEQVEEAYDDDDEGGEADRSRLTEEDELVPLNDTPQYKRDFGSRRSPGAYPRSRDEEEETAGSDEDEVKEDLNARVFDKIAKLNTEARKTPLKKTSQKQQLQPTSSRSSAGNLMRGLVFLTLMWLGTALTTFKGDSKYIGYCDAGSNTNLRMVELRANRQDQREAGAACFQNMNMSQPLSANNLCYPLKVNAVNPFEADTCTPCPKRAICTPDSVTCQSSFIPKSHWVARIPWVSTVCDGLPWMGSVAFPPTCVEDRERLRKIGGLVNGMESWLARERGKRLCANGDVVYGDGGEAKALGYELEALRYSAKQVTKRDPESADELFEKALAELEKYGAIIKDEDSDGNTYVAAVRADFNLACRLRVTARTTWAAYRNHVFSLVAFLTGVFELRRRFIKRTIENRRVKDLVKEALDTLEDQEIDYHSDPVTTREPYIVPTQLRDQILRDEHSPVDRQRVWEKVRKVVETNANVRTNLEEVKGEDTIVWRWVGNATPSARERRVSFHDRTTSGTLLKD